MQTLRFWFFVPYRGSNRISRLLRKKLERFNMAQLVGANLAGFAFVFAIVMPQINDVESMVQIESVSRETIIEIVPTDTKFQWPMNRFGISQRFTLAHPGADLTDPIGTPVYPIAEGWVAYAHTFPYGYGNHLLIEHDTGITSLYAHLSKIDVFPGQTVSKTTKLGEVGASGKATGNHLHLETYQHGTPINPFEILPNITK